jgi:hypothetical protein
MGHQKIQLPKKRKMRRKKKGTGDRRIERCKKQQ